MSKPWKVVLLGDICEIKSGGTPNRSEPSNFGGSIPWVKSGEVNQELVLETEESLSALGLQSSAASVVKAGAVLIAMYGATAGAVGSLGIDAATNQAVAAVTPTDPANIDSRYLRQFLSSRSQSLKASARGGAQPNLNLSILREIRVPLPPIEEQRRIATILDKADEIRTKRRAALTQLDTLTQAIFLDLFGDQHEPSDHDHKMLGDFADIVSGITIGRNLKDKAVESLPYLTVANVQDRRLELKVVKTTLATSEEAARYALLRNDILLTEGGDPDKLGRGTLWNNEIEGCIHQNHVFRVRMNTSMLQASFVSGLLSSAKGKRYFLRSAKQTTGIASINATQLRQFPVFVPSLELQNNYRNAVGATQDLETRLNCALYAANQAFAALQKSLFNPQGDRT